MVVAQLARRENRAVEALGEVAQAIPPALTTVASDGPREMTQSEIRGAARLYAAELECVLDGSKRGSQLRARFSELVSAAEEPSTAAALP